MYLKVVTATGIRRSRRAIDQGAEVEHFVQIRTYSDYVIEHERLNDIIEVLKRYPHPDSSPELDDPTKIRAEADFLTDGANPMLVFGYGAEKYDCQRWRPFFKLPLQLGLSLSSEDLETLVRTKEKEWLASTEVNWPVVARG